MRSFYFWSLLHLVIEWLCFIDNAAFGTGPCVLARQFPVTVKFLSFVVAVLIWLVPHAEYLQSYGISRLQHAYKG